MNFGRKKRDCWSKNHHPKDAFKNQAGNEAKFPVCRCIKTRQKRDPFLLHQESLLKGDIKSGHFCSKQLFCYFHFTIAVDNWNRPQFMLQQTLQQNTHVITKAICSHSHFVSLRQSTMRFLALLLLYLEICKFATSQFLCNEEAFKCKYNEDMCIPLKWVCDGSNDCIDGSDEILCATTQTTTTQRYKTFQKKFKDIKIQK